MRIAMQDVQTGLAKRKEKEKNFREVGALCVISWSRKPQIKHRVQKILAMLVVTIAEKSQRNRFMLESRARQRYYRLKTDGLVCVLDHCQFLCLFNMPMPRMRLPHDTLDTVARYVSALDELALKCVQ